MRFGPIIILSLLMTSQSLASGWVKGGHQYYAKVSYSETPDREYDAVPFDETESTIGLYAEYGLPLATATQLQLYGSIRETTRVATATDDSFVSRGFTDTEIRARRELLSQQAGQNGRLLVAAGLGAMLPTTSEDFRLGNETKRDADLPEASKPLVAPIDRGRGAGVVDVGATYSILSLWANLGMVYRQGSKFQALDSSLGLGSGLPGNSWVQLSLDQSRNTDEMESNTETSTIDSSMGISFGITYYLGMALELGYLVKDSSDDHWSQGQSWTAGLSFRSL